MIGQLIGQCEFPPTCSGLLEDETEYQRQKRLSYVLLCSVNANRLDTPEKKAAWQKDHDKAKAEYSASIEEH